MDKDSLIRAFTTKRDQLRRIAASISGEGSADDVLQDTFCRLWNCRLAGDAAGREEAISVATVRNRSIDIARQRSRHAFSDFDEGTTDLSTDDDGDATVSEKFSKVSQIIEQSLPQKQRDVLWMRDYEGLSFAEIAQREGTSEANVRQILSRARKQVRTLYRQNKAQDND